ncbi:TRAP transporter large permease subunit, partial [Anaerotruncus colihominis]
MIMFVMFIAVLAVLFIGVSTACSMALVSVGAYFSLGEATMSNMMSLPQGMFNQVSGITLMSIPFFLLMGNFMNAGGISQDL